jgi:hypothetical protein
MYREDKELPAQETKHPCLPKWRKRIDDAEKRGRFTDAEKDKAKSWNWCAVGEARAAGFLGGVIAGSVYELGLLFSNAVQGSAFARCREVIAAIESQLVS